MTCRTIAFGCVLAAAATLSACGGSDGGAAPAGETPAAARADATHSLPDQTLQLASLRSGGTVYSGVTLDLREDGTWSLKGFASSRQDADSVAAATLEPTRDLATLSSVADATQLKVRRLHRGSQVFAAVRLVLQGNRWSHAQAPEQAPALVLADFAANAQLAADHRQVVVLHSGAGVAVQRIPLRLHAGPFRLCAESQPGDRLTLLDAREHALASVAMGDACVSLQLAAGRYTMQQESTTQAQPRPVFFRHRGQPRSTAPVALRQTASQASPRPLRAAPTAWGDPEYWSIAPVGASAFLSLTSANWQCNGSFRADGSFTGFSMFILSAPTQFRVVRDANGQVTGLGQPLGCEGDSSLFELLMTAATGPNDPWPLQLTPTNLRSPGNPQIQALPIDMNDDGSFAIRYFSWDGNANLALLQGTGTTGTIPTFMPKLRYFPNGIGNARMDPGEVALWNSNDCSGSAYITRGLDLPYMGDKFPPASSVRLGPHTAVTAYAGTFEDPPWTGQSVKLTQSGCLRQPLVHPVTSPGALTLSMQIQVETVDLVVSAGGCADCDLSWLDFSTLDAQAGGCMLKGMNFARSNFTGAILTQCNLVGANLSNAVLASAALVAANLDGANLSSASFQGSDVAPTSASLNGAYLRHAKLDGANLTGASLTNATLTNATATGSTLNSANFSNAYLAGADFSAGGSTTSANGTNFSYAVLIGTRFNNATLGYDPVYGKAADFSYALLQGADFTGANVARANFNNAYVDLTGNPAGTNYYVSILDTATTFPGFQIMVNSVCQIAATSSVPPASWNRLALVTTAQPSRTPVTDNSTTCPDGGQYAGGCSSANWQPTLFPSPRLVPHTFGTRANGCSF